MKELTDEEIMLRVKEGYLPELAMLFERYHVPVYNFFYKLSFDRAGSEDMTQTLFYRMIRYRQSYDADAGSFRSWMYRMARNIYIDHQRQRRRESYQALEEEMGQGHAGDEGRYTEESFVRLESALARLPEAQREIILLSRFQGLKYAEIARVRDLTVVAVKVQVHRAIRHLRKIYFQQEEERI